MGIASVVVDCETGRFRMGLAETLSRHLDADHLAVTDVAAGTILEVVRRERAA
jgi:magnesium chelatase subunit D